jgi:deoxycytidylate deaminase
MKKWVTNITIKVALTSQYNRYLHGSVIEKSGRILAVGINEKLDIPTKHNRWSIHAEHAAIRAAGKHALGSDLYVARVTRGNVNNSKPCEMCQLHIKAAGIKRVFYSIDKDTWAVYEP